MKVSLRPFFLIKILILIAVLSCGRRASPPGKPDITPPEVEILSPADGSIVAGTTRALIEAKDGSPVVYTELMVQGKSAGQDTSRPYEFYFLPRDSVTTLQGIAKDAWDNIGKSRIFKVFLPESLIPKKDTLKDTLQGER